MKRRAAAAALLVGLAACKDSGSTGSATGSTKPPSTTGSTTAAPLLTLTPPPASTSGAPALLACAEGHNLRVRPLGPSGVVTAGYARAIVFGGDLRIDAALSRGPLQSATQWGSATFGGKWPDDSWSVQVTGAPGSAVQTTLQWSKDHWLKIDESPAHDEVAQIAAWAPGSALVLDHPGKDCGVVRVVGGDAGASTPTLDKRMCPQRMQTLASGDIMVAGRGFMQRLTKGQPSAPAAAVVPWGDSDKCPSTSIVVGAIGASDRGVVLAGRCPNADLVLVDYDGTFWTRTDGPDDADRPVAVHRTAAGHFWLLTAKRGHQTELSAKPEPAAGSLWFRPKGGLWNRVHTRGAIPSELTEGLDPKATTCVPTSFWARQDDDVWASYDCRAGDGDKAPTWSFVYRTGLAGGKPVRLTK